MTDILVDSNVILDVVTEDPQWFEWSAQMLTNYAEQGNLVINPIIYAEISIGFNQPEEVEAALPEDFFRRDSLPYAAAFLAGQSFLEYRRRGGERRSPLPDFYIGAHAAVTTMPLLTRDVNRYRTYFPSVLLITP
ncbi:MAG: type II toxin-antitoxin system VapC family toxin [Microcystis aeruginosa L111-01]|jgi:predicted nucleic acid-binding protein|uniref:Type II toxin-antitoxin system VapC family toxin n=1 Tax=Microcystis aeruginosa G11-04 TaxID=2685956 RepID=A0A966G4J7_MICAE|nr:MULTISPECIES: type II toxin-antitoxin system VapC family toxin [unclassified Microcystis]MCA2762211.1 type II toxin-antitoxin system VapC family toxin [Microcystis sp. M151S2]NCQ95598.1 type II toxin-antitoxin system VapC family toxin [Microcystis aeruginosa W11-03]NCR20885.1 type II toxin-antitoxin system VapC family toxin [Microcystis aeruginosa L111-01]NCR28798.1 type II toxin-antitoxin system VapC family toxin [Microcystis aeruginosa LE13-04]NCR95133.1 type II toxin-antitoxin system Vap